LFWHFRFTTLPKRSNPTLDRMSNSMSMPSPSQAPVLYVSMMTSLTEIVWTIKSDSAVVSASNSRYIFLILEIWKYLQGNKTNKKSVQTKKLSFNNFHVFMFDINLTEIHKLNLFSSRLRKYVKTPRWDSLWKMDLYR
jgi:hypothetical protein